MFSSLTALFLAGLTARNVFATPIPPPDCALDIPSTCTMPVDTLGHGALPGNILPPRDQIPCPLGGDCGPIVVDPTATSTSSASAATCTDHHGAIPIGEECFTSGPNAGQCITFECLDFPDTCGCPGAPPPAAKKAKRTANPAPTFTSTVASPSPTCTNPKGPIPIGTECFTSGPNAGQCITFECLEFPDACGCPGAPPPAARMAKRTADPAPTSTSTVTSPAPTCTVHHGVIPIGEVCFTSGPQAGQCVSIECRDNPNTCGCPGAPLPAPTQEKRSEEIEGDSAPSKRQFEGDHFVGGPGPVCIDGDCKREQAPTPFEECEDSNQCSHAIPRRNFSPTPIGTICDLDGSNCVCLDCEKEKRSESECIWNPDLPICR